MLNFYRKNIKTIIWVIVLSFVVWGVGTLSISKESSSPYAGSVFGQNVSQKEYLSTLKFYDLFLRMNRKSDGTGQKNEPFSLEQLRALTWQTIIISREANRQNIKVDDREVRANLESLFSENGFFEQNLYQNWVKENFHGRARDFEEVVRNHLAVQKMREKVLSGVSDPERDERWMEWLRNVIGSAQLKDNTAKD